MTFSVLPYLPNRFVWAFGLSVIAFYGLMILNFWMVAICIVLTILCLTTYYKVEVNAQEKWFNEYVWILGLKNGEPVKYSTLEYLFINRGKVTQTTSSRVQSTTITKDEYRGFIKFDGEEKIHVLTNSNHEKLVREMTKAAQSLQARLFDYSSGQPIQLV
jgi:hypothetical protein